MFMAAPFKLSRVRNHLCQLAHWRRTSNHVLNIFRVSRCQFISRSLHVRSDHVNGQRTSRIVTARATVQTQIYNTYHRALLL